MRSWSHRVWFAAVPIFCSDAVMAASGAESMAMMSGASRLLALLEIPFLLFCVVFAFLSARQLKGGVFRTGMMLTAWGFLVMGIGHLHMQLETQFDYNLFQSLFGPVQGRYAWFVALLGTWTLSGLGFKHIYRASRGR